MRLPRQCFLAILAALALVRCETMDVADPGGGGTIRVEGTMFYPDQAETTYIVPPGAQIIGAGGNNCHFIVEAGGSLTAHSGESNSYQIKAGGHFRGFTHPASQCTVTYEAGAIIEMEQSGPGTRFEAL